MTNTTTKPIANLKLYTAMRELNVSKFAYDYNPVSGHSVVNSIVTDSPHTSNLPIGTITVRYFPSLVGVMDIQHIAVLFAMEVIAVQMGIHSELKRLGSIGDTLTLRLVLIRWLGVSSFILGPDTVREAQQAVYNYIKYECNIAVSCGTMGKTAYADRMAKNEKAMQSIDDLIRRSGAVQYVEHMDVKTAVKDIVEELIANAE